MTLTGLNIESNIVSIYNLIDLRFYLILKTKFFYFQSSYVQSKYESNWFFILVFQCPMYQASNNNEFSSECM